MWSFRRTKTKPYEYTLNNWISFLDFCLRLIVVTSKGSVGTYSMGVGFFRKGMFILEVYVPISDKCGSHSNLRAKD